MTQAQWDRMHNDRAEMDINSVSSQASGSVICRVQSGNSDNWGSAMGNSVGSANSGSRNMSGSQSRGPGSSAGGSVAKQSKMSRGSGDASSVERARAGSGAGSVALSGVSGRTRSRNGVSKSKKTMAGKGSVGRSG